MFETLGQRLGSIFDRLKGRGVLSEADVTDALREIRIALLEADVALPVVRDFIAKVKERATGQEVIRSITPGQMVVKIVHDQLVEVLGSTAEKPEEEVFGLNLRATPPVVILMVGLQGSGKTTSTAKIANRLATKHKKKVLMASLDIYRPAAQEQLAILGRQLDIPTLAITAEKSVITIAKNALAEAKKSGHDILLLDSAGRLAIDEAMMAEISLVKKATNPTEILFVADAMTGQDAVNTATAFHQALGITGIVLTRIDGDARGGAALSMLAVTGQPIKLLGTGEKPADIEEFDSQRMAGRILGMGDIVSLVEKASEMVSQEDALKLAEKFQKGNFDLDDYLGQLRQMRKMGGMNGLMGMLPGVAKVKKQMAEAQVDDRQLLHQEAIIQSMTPKERRDWKILNAKRRLRIAAGSGTTVAEINRLLKQFQEISTMMKKMRGMQQSGALQRMMPGMNRALGVNPMMGGNPLAGMPPLPQLPPQKKR
ncbi:MAG: signal recognition particle protein [Candidatus Pacebacteria bacterium]|nr:signal recognition particle protein [Candidatus Paceibacterota bacterium]